MNRWIYPLLPQKKTPQKNVTFSLFQTYTEDNNILNSCKKTNNIKKIAMYFSK